MTAPSGAGRVIEIDLAAGGVAVDERRAIPRFVPALVALAVGALIGMFAADGLAGTSALAPTPRMHTVVVTEDGRSETFLMPAGSNVTTPPVTSSCSITIDGRFAAFISRVVGNAVCGATVP
jgi:hypothetical protein